MFNTNKIKNLEQRLLLLEENNNKLRDFVLPIANELYEQLCEKLISLCEIYGLECSNICPQSNSISIFLNNNKIYSTQDNDTIITMLRESITYLKNIGYIINNK